MKKDIFSLFLVVLIFLGAFFLSLIIHELMHIYYDLPSNVTKAICFNINPYFLNASIPVVAFVNTGNYETSYIERHYEIYFSQGFVFAAFLIIGNWILLMIMYPKQSYKRACFGSDEFNHFCNICKGCPDHKECEIENNKNNHEVRF